MRIVMIASEAAPYCGSGAAAGVVGALPRALAERGHRVTVVVPLHRVLRDRFLPVPEIAPIPVRMHDGRETGDLLRARDEPSGVEVYAIGADRYFDRPGLYGEDGVEYADGVRRFAFFCRAALGAIDALAIVPDVVHCHDWPTALVPVYLRAGMLGEDRATAARAMLADAAVVLSVHDISTQGAFPSPDLAAAGIPRGAVASGSIEAHGTFNVLREGLRRADAITTPSPRSARDVQLPEYGAGLDVEFVGRSGDVTGISSGIDTDVWDPATDRHLVAGFAADDVHGKRRCKADLLLEADLNAELASPVAAVLSPLVPASGFDILVPSLPDLLERGSRVVVVGRGEPRIASALRELVESSGREIVLIPEPTEGIVHKTLAGADLLLRPHAYEAGPTMPMRAQRYGTVPIVRASGGMVDTVLDVGAVPDRGTGFWIEDHSREALCDAVGRALDAYRAPDVWRGLQGRGMRRDHSWRHAAARYVQIYRRLAHRPNVASGGVPLADARWHGRVAEDFTVQRVRAAAQGLAEYLFEADPASALAQRGILVAHDTRLLGADFASFVAGVLAWNDVSVTWAGEPTTLPAAACAVVARGLAGAVVVSGEAADARWNGLHLLGSMGAPLDRESAVLVGERSAPWVDRALGPQELGGVEAREIGLRREASPAAIHRDVLEAVVDTDAIRSSGLRVACDLRWGAAAGTLDRLLRDWGVLGEVLHGERDPRFGGGSPDPATDGLVALSAVVRDGHDLGVAVDSSGTRLGLVDRGGVCLAPDHVFALLMDHLAETRGAGRRAVARSIATSRLVDALARRRGLPVVEAPTGFQELGALLARGDAFVAVDGSAFASVEGVAHSDAILAALLVVEMVAIRRRSLASQLEEAFLEFGPAARASRRIALPAGLDSHAAARLESAPEHVGEVAVVSHVSLEGVRLQLEDGGWIHARLEADRSTLALEVEAESPEAASARLDAGEDLFAPRG